MEHVAERRPQELRLRMRVAAQSGEFLGPVAFAQDLFHAVVHLGIGQAILPGVQIKHMDLFADLLVDAALGLLPQRALIHQVGEPARQFEVFMPRIFGQVLAHGVDHMREHVEPDHIQRAEGGALGTSQVTPGERIHGVEAEVERCRMMLGGEHGEHADAVGDEVGRVLCPHHTFAQRGDEESLQLVEQRRFGCSAGNQLDQVHIARRVEEMDAAKTMAQILGERLRQLIDRQTGCVAGEDRMGADIGRHFAVQIGFPVHALGDGFDDQIALAQFFQMLVVIRSLDVSDPGRAGDGRGVELLQTFQRLVHVAVGIAFFRGQFEQQRLDIGVDQMRGDLRTHHTCAKHGDFANLQMIAHRDTPRFLNLKSGRMQIPPLTQND